MVKNTIGLDDKVVEYDEDVMSCTSKRFELLPSLDWNSLYNNLVHFRIDASKAGSEEINSYFDIIESRLESYGFSKSDRIDFSISLSEALFNAQKHTLLLKSGEEVYLNVFFSDKVAFAGVTATGVPFDIQNAAESIKSMKGDLFRTCGRGSYIMAELCDVFYVTRSGSSSEVILGKLAG
ncbi:MAG TPA: ATP-binding protein [Candidatus Nanoarchaeia archaeon]|nr:ATP-binding protein [Candidatus Nanoarchaeia archaeon]